MWSESDSNAAIYNEMENPLSMLLSNVSVYVFFGLVFFSFFGLTHEYFSSVCSIQSFLSNMYS